MKEPSSIDHNSSREPAKKYMFLRLGQLTFSIPLSAVREVLGLGQISPLPNMPVYFAGLINLRGKIVSAVDLRKSLNFLGKLEESKSKRPCVIINEVDGKFYGAIVDDVLEVQAIPSDSIDNCVNGLENKDVFCGVIKRKDAPLAPILDLEKALRLKELINLQEKKSAS